MADKASTPPRRGRPRQSEVARLAGVSQTTVSLVLGGNKQGIALHEDTRTRVIAAARELGYVPDPAARRMARARNNLLGVFSFTATFPVDVGHSYYPILVGVEQEAVARGYDLVLFTGSSTGEAPVAAPGALERVRMADGCLFLGRHIPADELRRLVNHGYPAVHIGRRDELADLAWVGVDYVTASAEVVHHLAELGHRRIGLVRETDDAPASTDRERGFRTALAELGITGDAVFRTARPRADITPAWVRDQVAEGVTAFVAEETDTGAAWRQLLAAVEGADLAVPDDVSLALLGSPPADLAGHPEPTGFDVPRAELGAAAVRMATALLAGDEVTEPMVSCTFRPGRTAGPTAIRP